MKNIFDKKSQIATPKRNAVHKLFIFMIFMSLFNVFFNFVAGNMQFTILHSISGILWILTTLSSEKKYKKIVKEHVEKVQQQQQVEDMKNAFNFTNYKNN